MPLKTILLLKDQTDLSCCRVIEGGSRWWEPRQRRALASLRPVHRLRLADDSAGQCGHTFDHWHVWTAFWTHHRCLIAVPVGFWVQRAVPVRRAGSPLQLFIWYIPLQQWTGKDSQGLYNFLSTRTASILACHGVNVYLFVQEVQTKTVSLWSYINR